MSAFIRNLSNKVFFLLVLLAAQSIVHAEQVLSVEDGGSYSIKVSATEITRLHVDGGRLDKVWGLSSRWSAQPDQTSGELFIKSVATSDRRAFSFIVRDNFGNTYTLVASPMDVPSETVQLKPKNKKLVGQGTTDKAGSSQAYINSVKALMRDMVRGNELNYSVNIFSHEVPLWKETVITWTKQYVTNALVGDLYRIENKTDAEMVLDEREFSNFGGNVRAVALRDLVLQPHQTTDLFIIRGQEF